MLVAFTTATATVAIAVVSVIHHSSYFANMATVAAFGGFYSGFVASNFSLEHLD